MAEQDRLSRSGSRPARGGLSLAVGPPAVHAPRFLAHARSCSTTPTPGPRASPALLPHTCTPGWWACGDIHATPATMPNMACTQAGRQACWQQRLRLARSAACGALCPAHMACQQMCHLAGYVRRQLHAEGVALSVLRCALPRCAVGRTPMNEVENWKEGVCASGRGCRRSSSSEASAACSTACGPLNSQRGSRPASGGGGAARVVGGRCGAGRDSGHACGKAKQAQGGEGRRVCGVGVVAARAARLGQLYALRSWEMGWQMAPAALRLGGGKADALHSSPVLSLQRAGLAFHSDEADQDRQPRNCARQDVHRGVQPQVEPGGGDPGDLQTHRAPRAAGQPGKALRQAAVCAQPPLAQRHGACNDEPARRPADRPPPGWEASCCRRSAPEGRPGSCHSPRWPPGRTARGWHRQK